MNNPTFRATSHISNTFIFIKHIEVMTFALMDTKYSIRHQHILHVGTKCKRSKLLCFSPPWCFKSSTRLQAKYQFNERIDTLLCNPWSGINSPTWRLMFYLCWKFFRWKFCLRHLLGYSRRNCDAILHPPRRFSYSSELRSAGASWYNRRRFYCGEVTFLPSLWIVWIANQQTENTSFKNRRA